VHDDGRLMTLGLPTGLCDGVDVNIDFLHRAVDEHFLLLLGRRRCAGAEQPPTNKPLSLHRVDSTGGMGGAR